MQNVHSVDQTRTNRPHIPSDTIHVKEHRPAGQKPPEAPSSLRATRRPPSHLAPTEHPNRVAAVVSVRPWRWLLAPDSGGFKHFLQASRLLHGGSHIVGEQLPTSDDCYVRSPGSDFKSASLRGVTAIAPAACA